LVVAALPLTLAGIAGCTPSDHEEVAALENEFASTEQALVTDTDVWLDAECGATETAGYTTNHSALTGFAGSGYLQSAANTTATTPPTGQDRATYVVNAAAAGAHTLWVRVNNNNSTDDNSMYYRLGTGSWVVFNPVATAQTGWVWGKKASGGTLNLIAGNNTIEIANREDGLKIDKIYVTNTTTVPSGTGTAATNCGATCVDGVQNQSETGVDCGGPCNACATDPTCSDGIKNQTETGVDCGGPCSACVTCSDGVQNQSETGIDCGGPCAACSTLPLSATFAAGADSFVYTDDFFRNTNNAALASGIYNAGKIQVTVGGTATSAMSGGWARSFQRTTSGPVTVSFKYSMTTHVDIDPGEYVDALVSLDGVLYGASPNDYVRRIDGGGNQTEVTFSFTSPSLSVGTHSLRLGAYMNAATGATETATVTFDDVSVTAGGTTATCSDGVMNQTETGVDCGGTCSACATCTDGVMNQTETGVDCGGPCAACSGGASALPMSIGFASGADGFVYADNAFRSTNNAAYAAGQVNATKLEVTVGGPAVSTPAMSGGWSKSFTVASAGAVDVSFKYSMTTNDGIDPGEWVEVLVAIDSALYGLSPNDYVQRIEGGGNQVEVTRSFTTSSLTAGTHTIKLGAYMNGATSASEVGAVTFDDVSVKVAAAATCTDTIQNGSETGVDCGGPCAACATSQMLGLFDKSTDLFVPQFDSIPDLDDIQAQAAVGTMLNDSRFNGVNTHAVAGAYGNQSGSYVDSSALFNMAFGSANWSDNHTNHALALSTVVAKVKAALNAGGDIYVMEAGQSDFTRDWVQQVKADLPSVVTTARIHVYQHSTWNEGQTTPADLTYIKANTDYQKIADGNTVGNGTPGFNTASSSRWAFANAMPQSGPMWVEADRLCDIYNPVAAYVNKNILNGGMDFSDAAEACVIFGFGGMSDYNAFFTTFTQ
jgi:hypothetical protein